MNHDHIHCVDYDSTICPENCFRARLAKDLEEHWNEYRNIPVVYTWFCGTKDCPLDKTEANKLITKNEEIEDGE